MHPYVSELERYINQFADPEAAKPMKAYMRNQFEYLGVSLWQVRKKAEEFYRLKGVPALDDLDEVVHELWNIPYREFKYIAIDMLVRFSNDLPGDFIVNLENLITDQSWWDTVDSLAGEVVGAFFLRHPELRDKTLKRWRSSSDLWLRRTCLVFQLKYKNATDFELMKGIILENLGTKEFFINKAIGWALRQYSRVDPVGVKEFVNQTSLSNLSRKEALRWLENIATKQREKQIVYHITQRQAWVEAQKKDYYEPEGYASDGFIHCSTREQLLNTAHCYYANALDLVVLCLDPRKTVTPLKYENTTGGTELFPHLYGILNLDAVLATPELTRNEAGKWQMPEGLV